MDILALWEAIRPWWLVWMVILFGAIVFWALRPKNKQRFKEDADIPFRDGRNGG